MNSIFPLGRIIYYMVNSVVYSAPILASMVIANAHEDWVCTLEQGKTFTPFGKAGTYYATCHGVFESGKVFASKQELLESM